MAKDQVVTYRARRPDELRPTGVLHERGCRYLRPWSNRPDTGSRTAKPQELRTFRKCKVC